MTMGVCAKVRGAARASAAAASAVRRVVVRVTGFSGSAISAGLDCPTQSDAREGAASNVRVQPIDWVGGTMRKQLRDDQWKQIEGLLPGKVGDRGRSGADNRLFVEAVL